MFLTTFYSFLLYFGFHWSRPDPGDNLELDQVMGLGNSGKINRPYCQYRESSNPAGQGMADLVSHFKSVEKNYSTWKWKTLSWILASLVSNCDTEQETLYLELNVSSTKQG